MGMRLLQGSASTQHIGLDILEAQRQTTTFDIEFRSQRPKTLGSWSMNFERNGRNADATPKLETVVAFGSDDTKT